MISIEPIRAEYLALLPTMNERTRRLWAAVHANAFGHGGIGALARATGLSRNTVARGVRELKDPPPFDLSHVRRPKAEYKGRPKATVLFPGFQSALENMLEPVTRGGGGVRPLIVNKG
jgi:hypothetical protein